MKRAALRIASFQEKRSFKNERGGTMMFPISTQPLLAIISGILILAVPRILNYVVAVYLILVGILGLMR